MGRLAIATEELMGAAPQQQTPPPAGMNRPNIRLKGQPGAAPMNPQSAQAGLGQAVNDLGTAVQGSIDANANDQNRMNGDPTMQMQGAQPQPSQGTPQAKMRQQQDQKMLKQGKLPQDLDDDVAAVAVDAARKATGTPPQPGQPQRPMMNGKPKPPMQQMQQRQPGQMESVKEGLADSAVRHLWDAEVKAGKTKLSLSAWMIQHRGEAKDKPPADAKTANEAEGVSKHKTYKKNGAELDAKAKKAGYEADEDHEHGWVKHYNGGHVMVHATDAGASVTKAETGKQMTKKHHPSIDAALAHAKTIHGGAPVAEAEGSFKKTHEFITKDGQHAYRAGKNTSAGTWDHRHYTKNGNGWKHVADHGYDGHESKEDAAAAAKGDRDEHDSGKVHEATNPKANAFKPDGNASNPDDKADYDDMLDSVKAATAKHKAQLKGDGPKKTSSMGKDGAANPKQWKVLTSAENLKSKTTAQESVLTGDEREALLDGVFGE